MQTLTALKHCLASMPPESLAFYVAAPSRLQPSALGWVVPEAVSADFSALFPEAESDMVLALRKKKQEPARAFLFCAERDAKRERWSQISRGLDYWKHLFPQIQCLPLSELEAVMCQWGKEAESIAYPDWERREAPAWWQALLNACAESAFDKKTWLRSSVWLHEARNIKSLEEQQALRASAEKTTKAFQSVLLQWPNFQGEEEVVQAFYRSFLEQGAKPAYPPIVASGAHALCLHHSGASGAWLQSQGVVVDAGAAWKGWACDVTRTFYNAAGEPPLPLRRIHQIVTRAQASVIQNVRPGITWGELTRHARQKLWEGLCQSKVLDALPIWRREAISQAALMELLMPHALGHWVGREVHDVGPRGEKVALCSGQALAIEPGLYFPDSELDFAEWSGICVRIEDTLLVTPEGAENLTEAIPKNLGKIFNAA